MTGAEHFEKAEALLVKASGPSALSMGEAIGAALIIGCALVHAVLAVASGVEDGDGQGNGH